MGSLPFLSPSTKTIWLPHGFSDKGATRSYFEALNQELFLLIYGPKMAEVLASKHIQIPTIKIGNYRYQYFQKHRQFYEKLLTEQFGNRRFLFYAPSWEDGELSGMFWETYPKLIQNVPNHRHILIKVHPNTVMRFAPELEYMKGKAPPSIVFVEDFPPIYPLLSRANGYLGDRSSVGYDFLPFKQPLWFTVRSKTDPYTDPSAHLMRCGLQITVNEIQKVFEPQEISSQHDQLLEQVFQADSDWYERIFLKLLGG